MDALSELKELSDASDAVIISGKNHDKCLVEWFKIVQEITTAIYKNDIADDPESAINIKIPSIVPFTTETEKTSRKRQRLSSTLTQMQKHRISHLKKNSKGFALQDLNETENNPLGQCEKTAKSNFSNQVVEVISTSERKSSISQTNEMEGYYTPHQNSFDIPQFHKEEAKTSVITDKISKKRKSSLRSTSPTVIIKKVKVTQSKTSIPKMSLRKSLRAQNGKISESRLPKHVSRLPTKKISVTAINSSILKENPKLQMKLARDKIKILKKVQSDIKIKIQETKNKIDEKMNKTSYQHLKLKSENKGQSIKTKEKKVEKTLLKTLLDPKKKRLQEVTHDSDLKVKNSPHSMENMKANKSGTAIKTPQKKDIKKSAQERSENYEMTPVRSSYVSYDISEIKSDDSGDENETEDSQTERKPIPGWASGVHLRNALVQQQYYSINTDELFGNVFDTPNLCQMMGAQGKAYLKKRTSSAIWNSPSAF